MVLFVWNRAHKRWVRGALAIFPVTMALSLVYFGEHYVIDVFMGWAYVVGSFWFWGRWERQRVMTSQPDQGYSVMDRSDSREHRW